MVDWKSYSMSFAVYRHQAKIFIVPADGHQGVSVAVVRSASTSYDARRLLSGSNEVYRRLSPTIARVNQQMDFYRIALVNSQTLWLQAISCDGIGSCPPKLVPQYRHRYC